MSFRDGRNQARAARGLPPLDGEKREADAKAASAAGRGTPSGGEASPIKLGHYCPLDGDEVGAPLLSNTERAYSCLD